MGGDDARRWPHPVRHGRARRQGSRQKVSHSIEAGGRFEKACAELVGKGFDPLYVELWSEGGEKARKKKAASKTRYTCPECDTNAWAKPGVHLVCGDCDERMEAEDDAG